MSLSRYLNVIMFNLSQFVLFATMRLVRSMSLSRYLNVIIFNLSQFVLFATVSQDFLDEEIVEILGFSAADVVLGIGARREVLDGGVAPEVLDQAGGGLALRRGVDGRHRERLAAQLPVGGHHLGGLGV